MSFFVTFEGPEGCGKTTQLDRLAATLCERGQRVLTTREPGGTAIGDLIRSVLLDPARIDMLPSTEFLLFSAGRAQHVEQVIRPFLRQGGIVLCDRYADSSLAYQGYGRQQAVEVLRAITRFATGGLLPDLTLCLDLPVELGLRRKASGSGDSWNRMEQEQLAFHERVRAGYLAMAADEPARWVVIDASGTREQTQAAIRDLVLNRLDSLPAAQALR